MVASSGCVPVRPGPRTPSQETSNPPTRADAVADRSHSLFAQPWIWTDERGVPVQLSRWGGTLLVVTLVYTSCTTTCPLTVDKLLRLGDSFRRQGRPATFVLVTLDPSNDTPEQLRRFKATRGLPADWHLLRGNDQQTRELAGLLGVRIMNESSHIIHDGRIVFLDPQGRLLGQYSG
jgi:protein SCO1/2